MVIYLPQLSEIPIPLPGHFWSEVEIFLKFREGEDQKRFSARKNRGWSGITDNWCVVIEDAQ
jgi:hypothetical protein